jgi:signal transduction histidine kinase
MRLAEFILRDLEPILEEWEAFARAQHPAADHMDKAELRDQAAGLLRAIAADMTRPESAVLQRERSLGHTDPPPASATAVRTHAVLRARSGFDINQMCGEFRALRASVLRLWRRHGEPGPGAVDDILRFDEAVDEALIESIGWFDAQVQQSRNLLLGALGHDLRNPLDTIQLTAAFLERLGGSDHVSKAAQRLKNSGARMKSLLDDLLDYNRTTLGVGLHVAPSPIDLAEAAETEMQQLRTAHPGRPILLTTGGDTTGEWDRHRMQQLLANLVTNAIKYGDSAPVQVHIEGEHDAVRMDVRNRGPEISPAELQRIFEPLERGSTARMRPETTSLGLGLYIAREIVRAHDGCIEARHAAGETVFSTSLPRRPRQRT